MGEEWRQIARERVAELEEIAVRLQMYPPRDSREMELPYHINTLMRRAAEEFKTTFEVALKTDEDSSHLVAAHALWRDSAADFAATLGTLATGKDYFAQCREAFPGGAPREDIGDLIHRMEQLAIIQVQFGRDGKSVSRDYLNMFEVLTECGVVDDDSTLRRLTLRATGRTQTTAEAAEEFQLELTGALMLGEAERSAFGQWTLFRSGKAFRSGFAVQPLSDAGVEKGVYGVVYPGNFASPSWCYLTVAREVIIASQPADGDCGTSITNAWSGGFVRALGGFLREHHFLEARQMRLFEHYFDGSGKRGSTLDAVGLAENDHVVWSFVAQGDESVRKKFEELTGGPMQAFGAFGFIERMAQQFRSDAERRLRDLRRRSPQGLGGHINLDTNSLFRRPKHGPERGR